MRDWRKTLAWSVAKRILLDPARRAVFAASRRGRLPVYWYRSPNWGDALSPVLAGLLSGKRVIHVGAMHQSRYLVIGSILGSASDRSEVWGSGFIREADQLAGRPRAVHAVRGPLSREALIRQGVDCPEVYGDPALLLPRFLNPVVGNRFAVGIIPHYVDKGHPWLELCARDPQVKIVDVESDICEFVRDIKSCAVILSSSLHGLICADSYGIPSAWIRLSDSIIGGHFKFHDYQESIGMARTGPVVIQPDTSPVAVASCATAHRLNIDLRKLLLACPFLCQSLRNEVAGCNRAANELPNAFQSARIEEHLRTVAC